MHGLMNLLRTRQRKTLHTPISWSSNKIHAKMGMADKSTVEMTAPSGIYDMKGNTLTLNDDIALASSTGYAARLPTPWST